MGASPELDRLILPVHGGGAASRRSGGGDTLLRDARAARCAAECRFWGIVAVVMVAIVALVVAFVWFVFQIFTSVEYTVAITGVSGLDPATDLQRGGPLSPVFNLTIGMDSVSAFNGGCIKPRTSIKVSYSHLRVPMAGGRAPEMCVGPWGSAVALPAVAGGHDVALPGFLVDSLAEDMRRGDAMFEVQLTVLDDEGWRMVTCWARLGDDTGAALNIPCKETLRRTDRIPEEESGGYVPIPRPVPPAGPH
ncbi:hypothetical protein QOZ80_2AG0137700 [Eleusine coracana subsp. coracana]|nr:hypothetical protein QOZ80_2AG0137700 [Eleusine coracana subsp. coracana]